MPSRPWTWYSQAAQGGGVLGALGTHAFDTLHWLVGPTPQPAGPAEHRHHRAPLAGASTAGRGGCAEDIALIQLDLEIAKAGPCRPS